MTAVTSFGKKKTVRHVDLITVAVRQKNLSKNFLDVYNLHPDSDQSTRRDLISHNLQ